MRFYRLAKYILTLLRRIRISIVNIYYLHKWLQYSRIKSEHVAFSQVFQHFPVSTYSKQPPQQLRWESSERDRMIYVILWKYCQKQIQNSSQRRSRLLKQSQLLFRKQKIQNVFHSPSLSAFHIRIIYIEVTRSFFDFFCFRLDPVEIDQRFLAHFHNLKAKSCVFSLATALDFPAADDEAEKVGFNVAEFQGGEFGKGGLNADGQRRLFGLHLAVPVVLDGIVGAARQKAGNGGPSVSEGKDPQHQNPFFVIAPLQLHHPFSQVIMPPLTTLLASSIRETQSDA